MLDYVILVLQNIGLLYSLLVYMISFRLKKPAHKILNATSVWQLSTNAGGEGVILP